MWDGGNDFFPPTTFQVSNIHAGTGATNVIPGTCVIDFNLRFAPVSTAQSLQQRIEGILRKHGLLFDLKWTVGAQPFLTEPGVLVDALSAAIADETGQPPEVSTTGAPPTAASSPPSARRWWSSVRPMPRSTRSTSASRWRISIR